MKKAISVIFIFLASIGLVLHDIVPHHHSSIKEHKHSNGHEQVCCEATHHDYIYSSEVNIYQENPEDCNEHVHVCVQIDFKSFKPTPSQDDHDDLPTNSYHLFNKGLSNIKFCGTTGLNHYCQYHQDKLLSSQKEIYFDRGPPVIS